MIKSFADAVKELSAYIPPPGKHVQAGGGLDRMVQMMQSLGNPQDTYPIIHVGGTSGKGSTCLFTATLLQQLYPTVGLHMSPNLISVTERMQINGKNISEDAFAALAGQVLPVVEQMKTGGMGPPTYFELLTAMTLLYFAQQEVDVAVIEVGLGGRLDATNVVRSRVAVLTNVGLDHTDLLGDTVEQISRDKVGIIKQGNRVVTGVTQSSVQAIVRDACSKTAASLSQMGEDFQYQVNMISPEGSQFSYSGRQTYDQVSLAAPGAYQPGNAALALRAVEEFQLAGSYALPSAAMIHNAWSQLRIPGRMEIMGHSPVVVLDGAHNPDKMMALEKSIQTLFPDQRIVTVLAIKQGKDTDAIVQIVGKWSTHVVITSFAVPSEAGTMASYSVKELAQTVHTFFPDLPITTIPDASAALRHAQSLAAPDDIILVTGSLYLIGEIKRVYS